MKTRVVAERGIVARQGASGPGGRAIHPSPIVFLLAAVLSMGLWVGLSAALFADDTSPEAANELADLSDLAFLAGCWSGPIENGTIEEFYSTPTSNLIVGTTRYIRDGVTVQYEFTRIEASDSGVLMTPYPGGKPSADSFRLTSVGAGEAVFEAPEHDFPKRIIYRTNADETRTIRIDDGSDDGQAMEWHVEAVACPGPQ